MTTTEGGPVLLTNDELRQRERERLAKIKDQPKWQQEGFECETHYRLWLREEAMLARDDL